MEGRFAQARESCGMIGALIHRFHADQEDALSVAKLPLSIVTKLHEVRNLFRNIMLGLVSQLHASGQGTDINTSSEEFLSEFSRFISFLDCIDLSNNTGAIFLNPLAQDRPVICRFAAAAEQRLNALVALLMSPPPPPPRPIRKGLSRSIPSRALAASSDSPCQRPSDSPCSSPSRTGQAVVSPRSEAAPPEHPLFASFVRLIFRDQPFLASLSLQSCLDLALLWHPNLSPSSPLFQLLLNLYSHSSSKAHQARLFSFLERWADLFSLSQLPEPNFGEILSSAAEQQQDHALARRHRIRQSVLHTIQAICQLFASYDPALLLDELGAAAQPSAAHPLPLHRNRKLLLRAALTLLASLLDGLCWAHRHAVSTYDLFSCHPSAPRPESIATALNCSSLISRWITAEILQHERLESRALALECALTLIQKATELKNLELAVALARGICHPAILRLGATFDALSPAVLSLFQSYTSRFFPNANLRSTPLSDSYPSGTLCPLQPLVAAIHRSYIQLGPLSSLQQDDAIDDVLGRHERILELAECYHFPTCISFLDVSVQAYQVSKLRGLLCNEATEIRDIIYSYGLQGNDDHLNAASLRLEPSSTGALQFMPKLPPRARSCFPYPPEVCALLLTIEPESIFRSTARTQAKLRRKSVKVALSNWKASTTHSEIEAVVSAWSGVRLGH